MLLAVTDNRFVVGGLFIVVGLVSFAVWHVYARASPDQRDRWPPLWGPLSLPAGLFWFALGAIELLTGFLTSV